jgi:RNA polymerase sigma-32 factor
VTDQMFGPEQGLTRYLQKIQTFPLLTEAEERGYARLWRDTADRDALQHLVNSHLRLVARMAMDNRGYGLPVEELISEGNVGLMQAIQKFDPERGFRLSTYARWWIRAAMQDYILRSWSLVKMGTTAAQKKLFFNLRRLKARLQELEDGDLSAETVAQIAEELKVPQDEVVEMNRRLGGPDHSLNATIGEENTEWQDWLVSEGQDQEARLGEREELKQRRRMLGAAMDQLNDRERHILVERRLRDNPITLEGLSQEYNISRERVRQIEVRAFNKVQKAVRKSTMAKRVAAHMPRQKRPEAQLAAA